MADRNWQGGAPRVAQVNTFAFAGTWEANDTIKASFSNGKSYLFTAGSTTAATIVANIVAAWNLLSSTDYPEFAEITASASTATLILTHDTAGKPFTVTLTPYESDGATAADAQTIEGAGTATTGTIATACSSPNHWNIAANWAENAVPANTNNVYITRGPSIKYGLAQSAVTLASLTISPSFLATSEIGLPNNTNPTSPESGYPEYRDQRLAIGATLVDIETVSRRIRLDLSSASTTPIIRDSGQPATATEDAIDLKLAATANVFIHKGYVGINNQPGDTGTIADLNVSFRTSPASDVRLRCGVGCTITNLDMSGGQVFLKNGAGTITKSDGVLTLEGAVTTLKNRAGTVYLDGTGTITLLENGGECWKRGFQAMTITTLRLFAGSRGSAGDAVITYTNDVEWYECRLPSGPEDRGTDVAWWSFGRHKALTPAAV